MMNHVSTTGINQYPSVSSSSAPSFKMLRLGGAKSISDQSSVAKSRTSRRHSSTSSPKDCKNGPRMVAGCRVFLKNSSFSIVVFICLSISVHFCSFLFYLLKLIKPQGIVIFKRFTENIQGTPSRERSRIQRLLANSMASMAQYSEYLTVLFTALLLLPYFAYSEFLQLLVFNHGSSAKRRNLLLSYCFTSVPQESHEFR